MLDLQTVYIIRSIFNDEFNAHSPETAYKLREEFGFDDDKITAMRIFGDWVGDHNLEYIVAQNLQLREALGNAIEMLDGANLLGHSTTHKGGGDE